MLSRIIQNLTYTEFNLCIKVVLSEHVTEHYAICNRIAQGAAYVSYASSELN